MPPRRKRSAKSPEDSLSNATAAKTKVMSPSYDVKTALTIVAEQSHSKKDNGIVVEKVSWDLIIPSKTLESSEETAVPAKKESTMRQKISRSNSITKKGKQNTLKTDTCSDVPRVSSTLSDAGAVSENVDTRKLGKRGKKSKYFEDVADAKQNSGVLTSPVVKKKKYRGCTTRKKTVRVNVNKNNNNSNVKTGLENTKRGPMLKKRLSVIEEVCSSDEDDDINDNDYERLTPKFIQNVLVQSSDKTSTDWQYDRVTMGVDPTSLAMETDVSKVLMLMEGPKLDIVSRREQSSEPCNMDGTWSDDGSRHEDESDKEESDWEVVEEHHLDSPSRSQLPNAPVQVILDAPDVMSKRKKAFDMKAYFKRLMNKFQKDVRIAMHKVHVLCLIVHGRYLNNLCLAPTLHAILLSRMPSEVMQIKPASCSVTLMSKAMQWFTQVFEIDSSLAETPGINEELLQLRAAQSNVASPREYVFLFLAALRVLGLTARLLYLLDPIPLQISKASSSQKTDKKTNASNKRSKNKSQEGNLTKTKSDASPIHQRKRRSVSAKCSKQKGANEELSDNVPSESQSPEAEMKSKYFHSTLEKFEFSKRKEKSGLNICSELSKDKNFVKTTISKPVKNNRRRSTASKVSYREKDSDDDNEDDNEVESDNNSSKDADGQDADGTDAKGKGVDDKGVVSTGARDRRKSHTKPMDPSKWKLASKDELDLSSDSEFEPAASAGSNSRSLSCKLKKNKLSFMQSDEHCKIVAAKIQNQTFDVWTEVYLEKEQRWICIDIVYGQIDKPQVIEEVVTSPVMYVLAFDNDGSIKDLTARYASQWLTTSWRSRAGEDWMKTTLRPYRTLNSIRDKVEDELIKGALLDQPLPTTISEYKRHPLYALKRHLLKFESFYPESVVPLGYIRSEAVYARECVHELHSRETWMKDGRNVKVGEVPYKMAKSRAKWKKPKPDKDTLCLFGHWQTEIYVPLPAVNGKVPVNEYGNVEMFQPSMLPAGTVHLRIPGLNKVARKLELDCIPAMMGWEQHCRFAKPILDGFIVCQEHKDTLLAAWDEEQEIQRQKDVEKREKRAVANWKLLVRAMIIRERLKTKFKIEGHTADKPTQTFSKNEKATDVKLSWPWNKQKDQANMKDSNAFFDVEKL